MLMSDRRSEESTAWVSEPAYRTRRKPASFRDQMPQPFMVPADDRGQKPAGFRALTHIPGWWRRAGLPGNGVKGPLTPIVGGKGPFTSRAEASDGGRGPSPQDGRGV